MASAYRIVEPQIWIPQVLDVVNIFALALHVVCHSSRDRPPSHAVVSNAGWLLIFGRFLSVACLYRISEPRKHIVTNTKEHLP